MTTDELFMEDIAASQSISPLFFNGITAKSISSFSLNFNQGKILEACSLSGKIIKLFFFRKGNKSCEIKFAEWVAEEVKITFQFFSPPINLAIFVLTHST